MELDKKNSDNVNPIKGIKFDSNQSVWVEYSGENPVLFDKSEISILDYNVWFEPHNWTNRCSALLSLFETYNADVICLQEVISSFTNYLMKSKFIRDNYIISYYEMSSYDTLILSKYHCNFYLRSFQRGTETNMGRSLLLAEIFCKESSIFVGTSHLESLNNQYRRELQLKIVFSILNETEICIFVGDCNFDNKTEDENIDPNFVDAWKVWMMQNKLDKSDGYTMKAMGGFSAWRPDKLLFKANKLLELAYFEIVGKEAISVNSDEWCNDAVDTPSDHYGLFGKFNIIL